MYRVLDRKYRPQSFADVRGPPQVTTVLKKQIVSDRLSHAYLFTGSRGIGKTTCAKILAKAVNCLNPVDGNPCNECEVCRGIDDDSIQEVVEMDAASNNGVGDVRDLQERLAFPPTRTKYRVYIIDEVHMMSSSAFNALLKTLEEPPANVMFILATTEVHELPATILSRCQRMDFRRISAEDIAGRLEEIAADEGASVEHNAALLIGRIADGGMRDAISLLDQCLARADKVDESVVRDAAGLAGQEHLIGLSDAISERDSAAVMIKLGELHALSKDMMRLCEELIAHYRSLMLINTVSKPEELIVATTEQLDQLRADAKRYPTKRIMSIIDTLQTALEHMGRGAQRRTELELALLRICRESDAPAVAAADTSELEKRVRALEKAVREGVAARPADKTPSPPIDRAAMGMITELSDKAEPYAEWSEIIAKIESESRALFSVLNGSRAYISGAYMLIETGDIGADLMRQPTSREILRRLITERTGKQYKLAPYRPSSSAQPAEVSKPQLALDGLAAAGIPISREGE